MGISDFQNSNERETVPNTKTVGHCEGGVCIPDDPRKELSQLRRRQTTGTSSDIAADLYRFSATDLPGLTLVDGKHDLVNEAEARVGRVEVYSVSAQFKPGDHAGPGSLRRRKLLEEYAARGSSHPPKRDTSNPVECDTSNPTDRNTTKVKDRVAPNVEITQPKIGDGRVTEIGPRELRHAIQTSTRPVVVEVYKDNCPGCTSIDPQIRKFADSCAGKADVYRMNVNQLTRDPELHTQMNIKAVPATFTFEQGKMTGKEIGFRDAQFFEHKIDGVIHHAQKVKDSNSDQNKKTPMNSRLEHIKEKLHHLTHLGQREREEAFKPSTEETRTLALINQVRANNGLGPVVQDPRLQIIARRHTAYQITHGMTHDESTPGWQNVSQRMQQVGLQGWRENAAIGSFTPEKLVQMWWESIPHRAALLGQGNIAAVAIRGGSATFNITNDPEMSRY